MVYKILFVGMLSYISHGRVRVVTPKTLAGTEKTKFLLVRTIATEILKIYLLQPSASPAVRALVIDQTVK